MKKVLCIGSSTKDIFFPTSEGSILDTPEDITSQRKIAFELGAKYKIEDRYEVLGGCAANVAAGLAALGVNSACYTTVGDDATGKWIRRALSKSGVNTELIQERARSESDLSAIIIDQKSGERVNEKFTINKEHILSFPWIFIGDLGGEWEKTLDDIMRPVIENGTRVAWNPRQSNIKENTGKITSALKYCEILLLNKDESIDIVAHANKSFSNNQLNDEVTLARSLKELGPKLVALTDGVRGAWICSEDKIFHAGAIRVEDVRDTTGAGDAFSSGFIAAYVMGKELEECAKWGIANSAHVVRQYGANKGVLSEEEIARVGPGVIVEDCG